MQRAIGSRGHRASSRTPAHTLGAGSWPPWWPLALPPSGATVDARKGLTFAVLFPNIENFQRRHRQQFQQEYDAHGAGMFLCTPQCAPLLLQRLREPLVRRRLLPQTVETFRDALRARDEAVPEEVSLTRALAYLNERNVICLSHTDAKGRGMYAINGATFSNGQLIDSTSWRNGISTGVARHREVIVSSVIIREDTVLSTGEASAGSGEVCLCMCMCMCTWHGHVHRSFDG